MWDDLRTRHRQDLYWIVVLAIVFGAALAIQVLSYVAHVRLSAAWAITLILLCSCLTYAVHSYVERDKVLSGEDRDRRK